MHVSLFGCKYYKYLLSHSGFPFHTLIKKFNVNMTYVVKNLFFKISVRVFFKENFLLKSHKNINFDSLMIVHIYVVKDGISTHVQCILRAFFLPFTNKLGFHKNFSLCTIKRKDKDSLVCICN